MNLFELMGCCFALAGAVIGGSIGYSHLGVPGAVLGLPLGYIAGYYIGPLAGLVGFLPGIVFETVRQRVVLYPHFGPYWARGRAEAWKELERRVVPGDSVAGTIAASFYYGVFLDTGHGFPALLKPGHASDDLRRVRVGTVVAARVRELDPRERCIDLSQKDPIEAITA